jgi:DNA-nicking Smr family endonuclease
LILKTFHYVAFNHEPSSGSEAEYDRLRANARQEIQKRQELSRKSQEAYQRGDGALAHELSEKSKEHAREADIWNEKASNFILLENNSTGRVPSDTIDLHGQYVEEAENILRKKIKEARQQNQTHLHVIVGKGNHSQNHVQKIKPAVERMCNEMGLAHRVEHNEGRIYIDLTGNQNIPAQLPPPGQSHYGNSGYSAHQQGYQQPASAGYQQPHHQQQHYQQQQQQQQDDGGCLGLIVKILKAIFSK